MKKNSKRIFKIILNKTIQNGKEVKALIWLKFYKAI
jgi:hypothetical protein